MKIKFIFILFFLPAYGSLFLTPEEKKEPQPEPIEKRQSQAFKLKAIFYRPDLQYWIVWINDTRIDSRYPLSIEGWTVTHVNMDNVTLRSAQGQELTLFLPLQSATEQEDPQD